MSITGKLKDLDIPSLSLKDSEENLEGRNKELFSSS
jgi:hypothetical protein